MHFKFLFRNVYGFIASSVGANQPPSHPLPANPAAPFSQAQLQTEVDRFRLEHDLPALAAVLVSQDHIHSACSGLRRIDAADLIQITDHFQLGSLSKAVTATLIARLIEQGKLRWDATLAELLPAWREQMCPDYHSVTVAQLLQHRSGLPRDFHEMDYPSLLAMLGGNPIADRTTAARWVLQQPRSSPHKTNYSDLGYLIVGIIAETIGGNTYENLLQQHVLQPLNISSRFGYYWPVLGHRWRSVRWFGESTWQVEKTSSEKRQLQFALSSASGLTLSLPDYGVFLREHLLGLRGESTLLDQANFKQLHTPLDHYALGWSIIQSSKHGAISVHDGSGDGSASYTLMIPSKNLAVSVMCNCEISHADAKLVKFAESLIRLI